MKKIIAVLLLGVLLTPSITRAQTVEEQIASLQAQVAQLMQLLSLVQQLEDMKVQMAQMSTRQQETNELIVERTETRTISQPVKSMPEITIGESTRDANLIYLPVTITGQGWRSAYVRTYIPGQNFDTKHGIQPNIPSNPYTKIVEVAHSYAHPADQQFSYEVKVYADKENRGGVVAETSGTFQ